FVGRDVANVGNDVRGLSSFGANIVGGLLQGLFAAAGEKNIGAEFGEAEGHGAAEAGAASGNKHCAVFQQVGLVHGDTSVVRHTILHVSASTARLSCEGDVSSRWVGLSCGQGGRALEPPPPHRAVLW